MVCSIGRTVQQCETAQWRNEASFMLACTPPGTLGVVLWYTIGLVVFAVGYFGLRESSDSLDGILSQETFRHG